MEYLKKSKTIECDINPNHRVKKNGKKDGVQRYYCNDCKKSIPLTKNTMLEHLKLTYNQLKILLRCMYDYKSLTEISLEIGLCRTSVFELQIRIFSALEIIHNDEILEGIVQVDEKYERTSFKGFSKEKMPRCSRYNGKDGHISGISNDQVCIIVAIDEKDHLIIKVAGNGPASTNMINKALKNRIKSKKDKIKIAIDNTNRYVREENIDGIKTVVCFIDYEYRNDIAEYFKKNNTRDCDVVAMVALDNDQISIRGLKNNDYSRILAEKYGGGGHNTAAAIPLSSNYKSKIIDILFNL